MTIQSSPYLKNQWQFPYDDLRGLSHQVDIAYIDIAQKMNARIIGQYPLNFSVPNGERWYLSGSNTSQQALRRIYTFTGAGNIPHSLNWASVSAISPNSYGSFTDESNWYGVIFGSSTPIAAQVSFYVTPTNIVILAGSGSPSITSGTINLEWISAY